MDPDFNNANPGLCPIGALKITLPIRQLQLFVDMWKHSQLEANKINVSYDVNVRLKRNFHNPEIGCERKSFQTFVSDSIWTICMENDQICFSVSKLAPKTGPYQHVECSIAEVVKFRFNDSCVIQKKTLNEKEFSSLFSKDVQREVNSEFRMYGTHSVIHYDESCSGDNGSIQDYEDKIQCNKAGFPGKKTQFKDRVTNGNKKTVQLDDAKGESNTENMDDEENRVVIDIQNTSSSKISTSGDNQNDENYPQTASFIDTSDIVMSQLNEGQISPAINSKVINKNKSWSDLKTNVDISSGPLEQSGSTDMENKKTMAKMIMDSQMGMIIIDNSDDKNKNYKDKEENEFGGYQDDELMKEEKEKEHNEEVMKNHQWEEVDGEDGLETDNCKEVEGEEELGQDNCKEMEGEKELRQDKSKEAGEEKNKHKCTHASLSSPVVGGSNSNSERVSEQKDTTSMPSSHKFTLSECFEEEFECDVWNDDLLNVVMMDIVTEAMKNKTKDDLPEGKGIQSRPLIQDGVKHEHVENEPICSQTGRNTDATGKSMDQSCSGRTHDGEYFNLDIQNQTDVAKVQSGYNQNQNRIGHKYLEKGDSPIPNDYPCHKDGKDTEQITIVIKHDFRENAVVSVHDGDPNEERNSENKNNSLENETYDSPYVDLSIVKTELMDDYESNDARSGTKCADSAHLASAFTFHKISDVSNSKREMSSLVANTTAAARKDLTGNEITLMKNTTENFRFQGISPQPLIAQTSKDISTPPLTAQTFQGHSTPPLTAQTSQGISTPPLTAQTSKGISSPALTAQTSQGISTPQLTALTSQCISAPQQTAMSYQCMSTPPLIAQTSQGISARPLTAQTSQGISTPPLTAQTSQGIITPQLTALISHCISTPLTSQTSQGISARPLTALTSQGISTPPLTAQTFKNISTPPLTAQTYKGISTPPLTVQTSQGISAPQLTALTSQGISTPQLTALTSQYINTPLLKAQTSQGISAQPLTAQTSQGISAQPLTAQTSTNISTPPLTAQTYKGISTPPLTVQISQGISTPQLTALTSQGISTPQLTALTSQCISTPQLTALTSQCISTPPLTAQTSQGISAQPLTAQTYQGISTPPLTAQTSQGISTLQLTALTSQYISTRPMTAHASQGISARPMTAQTFQVIRTPQLAAQTVTKTSVMVPKFQQQRSVPINVFPIVKSAPPKGLQVSSVMYQCIPIKGLILNQSQTSKPGPNPPLHQNLQMSLSADKSTKPSLSYEPLKINQSSRLQLRSVHHGAANDSSYASVQNSQLKSLHLVKSSQDFDKTSHTLAKTSHPLDKTSDTLGKTSHPLDKTSDSLDKASHLLDKTSDSLGKTSHILDKTSHPLDKIIHPFDKTNQPVDMTSHFFDKTSHPVDKTSHSSDNSTSNSYTSMKLTNAGTVAMITVGSKTNEHISGSMQTSVSNPTSVNMPTSVSMPDINRTHPCSSSFMIMKKTPLQDIYQDEEQIINSEKDVEIVWDNLQPTDNQLKTGLVRATGMQEKAGRVMDRPSSSDGKSQNESIVDVKTVLPFDPCDGLHTKLPCNDKPCHLEKESCHNASCSGTKLTSLKKKLWKDYCPKSHQVKKGKSDRKRPASERPLIGINISKMECFWSKKRRTMFTGTMTSFGRIMEKLADRDLDYQIHDSNRLVECIHCKEHFISEQDFMYHMVDFEIYINKSSYRCKCCKLRFTNLELLNSHFLLHSVFKNKNGNEIDLHRDYECKHCEELFCTQRLKLEHDLMDHCLGQVHANLCSECKTAFPNRIWLHMHYKLCCPSHDKQLPLLSFRCQYCGSEFNEEKHRNHHEESCMKVSIHHCPYCGIAMAKLLPMAFHISFVHYEVKMICCTKNDCSLQFESPLRQMCHRVVDHHAPYVVQQLEDSQPLFHCQLCRKSIYSVLELYDHLSDRCRRPHSKWFDCQVCELKFLSHKAVACHTCCVHPVEEL